MPPQRRPGQLSSAVWRSDGRVLWSSGEPRSSLWDKGTQSPETPSTNPAATIRNVSDLIVNLNSKPKNIYIYIYTYDNNHKANKDVQVLDSTGAFKFRCRKFGSNCEPNLADRRRPLPIAGVAWHEARQHTLTCIDNNIMNDNDNNYYMTTTTNNNNNNNNNTNNNKNSV